MSDTVGRVRDKKYLPVLMPKNGRERVESCPPVANGPSNNHVCTELKALKAHEFSTYINQNGVAQPVERQENILKVIGAKPITVPNSKS